MFVSWLPVCLQRVVTDPFSNMWITNQSHFTDMILYNCTGDPLTEITLVVDT